MTRAPQTFERRACITGCGATTAVGYTAEMTAASVRANMSRARESHLIDKAGEPMVLSMAGFLDGDPLGVDRLVALAAPAATEAVAPLATAIDGGMRIPILCGLSDGRPGEPPNTGAVLLQALAAQLKFVDVRKSRTLPLGHASGLVALQEAVEWIGSGKEPAVLVGGVDSYYDADVLEWLDDTRRLHSDANRDGFVPGEGAGFCLVMSEEAAAAHGSRLLASIVTITTTEELHPLVSDGICTGQGLTEAFHQALETSSSQGQRADWALCDMNGESFRSREWVYAYLRTGRHHRDPLELWHPADCYGDIGAASGPVLTGIAIAAWRRSYARGPQALVWASSDTVHRSAVLLRAGAD